VSGGRPVDGADCHERQAALLRSGHRPEPTEGSWIFIANADGSDARRLTTAIRNTHSFDTESQWSRDGKRLAFTGVRNSRQAAVAGRLEFEYLLGPMAPGTVVSIV
jgi:hypothetical protein